MNKEWEETVWQIVDGAVVILGAVGKFHVTEVEKAWGLSLSPMTKRRKEKNAKWDVKIG